MGERVQRGLTHGRGIHQGEGFEASVPLRVRDWYFRGGRVSVV